MPSDGRRTDQPHVLISSFWILLERVLLHREPGMVAATRQARPAVERPLSSCCLVGVHCHWSGRGCPTRAARLVQDVFSGRLKAVSSDAHIFSQKQRGVRHGPCPGTTFSRTFLIIPEPPRHCTLPGGPSTFMLSPEVTAASWPHPLC